MVGCPVGLSSWPVEGPRGVVRHGDPRAVLPARAQRRVPRLDADEEVVHLVRREPLVLPGRPGQVDPMHPQVAVEDDVQHVVQAPAGLAGDAGVEGDAAQGDPGPGQPPRRPP